MRKFNKKECSVCGNTYTPIGSCSKYCSDECKKVILRSKQKEYSARYNKKRGREVGVGSGGLTKSGKDNFNYKTGLGIFAKLRPIIKEKIRYCERCNKDLINATRYEWCIHHKDHNRNNNSEDNFELLCKRCHQIEHNCIKALEGVETKCERDPLTGRYKRIEAPNSES
jgi:predicted nucleic acid-binding Zn ribbon protein